MSTSLSLGPEVESLATALGILKPDGNGVSLDPGFFSAPWDRLGTMLSNDVQRAALVSALEGLLRPAEADRLGTCDDGTIRRCYPLLEDGKPGQVYLVVERASAAPESALSIGVAAEMFAGDDGPSLVADLVLIAAQGGTVSAVAGHDGYPLRIEARAPVGSDGDAIAASLLVLAPFPTNQESGRLTIRIEGNGGSPLEWDVFKDTSPIGAIVTALLRLAADVVGDSAGDKVKQLAEALPKLLGLTDEIPPFPLGDLLKTADAFRTWLAALAAPGQNGEPRPLVAWLAGLGTLLGATLPSGALPDGSEDHPLTLTIAGSATTPELSLAVGVRTDAQTGTSTLVISTCAILPSTALGACVQADAVLFAIPLGGIAPVSVFERFDIAIAAPPPGSDHPLIDAAATGGALSVGALRAGVRYQAAPSGPQVTPLLELDVVDITIAGKALTYDRLDLTSASTLSSAAETALADALSAGLGVGTAAVDALKALLGLGNAAPLPSLDVALFAGDPVKALAKYYRDLRACADGWPKLLLGSLGTLVGSIHPLDVQGTGTADDPWRIAMDPINVDNSVGLNFKLALWDEGDATTPRLRLGLGAEMAGTGWDVWSAINLLAVDLPADRIGPVQWLGGIQARGSLTPPADGVGSDGLVVRADAVALAVRWTAGQKLALTANVTNVSVDVDGSTFAVGTLTLPPPAGLDVTKPDLGLGVDANALSSGLRALVARAIGSWAGPTARALTGLLLGGAPQTPGLPDELLAAAAQHFDLSALLQSPLAAIRAWLSTLASDAAALTADGVPLLRAALEGVHYLLTGGMSLPGRDPLQPALSVYGAGAVDSPWALPLQALGEEALELALWQGPAGPPSAWMKAALPASPDEIARGADLLSTAFGCAGRAADIADLFRYRDAALSGSVLEFLDDVLFNSDGIVDCSSAIPDAEGWTMGEAVAASHDALPAAAGAVSQIKNWLGGLAASSPSDDWTTVLLAPRLAAADCWEALLSGVAAADRSSVSLRIPGAPPKQADLGGMVAARWYVVDLADDGDGSLDDAVASLDAVLAAIRKVNPSARVVVVAHSYLGRVAQAFAAAQPTALAGLAVLGTPFGDTYDNKLADPSLHDALRMVASLVPGGLASVSAPLGQAVDLLGRLASGWEVGQAGAAPLPSPFPASAFARPLPTPFDATVVPALAIPGSLDDHLIPKLAAALTAAYTPAGDEPTHLAWGIRTGLGLPEANDGEPDITADVTFELGRLALTGGGVSLDPPPAATVHIAIGQPDGWLIDDPTTGVHVRWLELIGKLTVESGAPALSVNLKFHDAGLRGDVASALDLEDPRAPELLDNIVRTLDDPKKLVPGGRLDALLSMLASAGLVRRAGAQAAAALSDGWQALARDARAWLAPHAQALLDSDTGFFGFKRAAGALAGGGPWTIAWPSLAFQVVIETAPWRISVRGDGLDLGPECSLKLACTVPLASPSPQVTGQLVIAGTAIGRDTPGGPLVLTAPWIDSPLSLIPLDANAGKILIDSLPRLLASAVLTVVGEQFLGGGMRIAALDGLLRDPAAWLCRAAGLGDGVLPVADRLKSLIKSIADPLGLAYDPSKPLPLPSGLIVDFSNAGVDAGRTFALEVGTSAPIALWGTGDSAATLALNARLDVDASRHVTPGGSLSLTLPLPGGWGGLTLAAGADTSGLSFKVSTTSGLNLTLMPSVSGLDTLLSAAENRLLPAVLDQVAGYFDAKTPRPAVLDDILAVAQALSIYDPTAAAGTGFAQRADQLAKLVGSFTAGTIQTQAAALASAAATLLQRLLGNGAITVPPTSAPGKVSIGIGPVTVEADFASTPIGVQLGLAGLTVGVVTLDLGLGLDHGAPSAKLDVAVAIDLGIGPALNPGLSLSWNATSQLSAGFSPLGLAPPPGAPSALLIPLFPNPAPPNADQLVQIAEDLLLPMALSLVLDAVDKAGVLTQTLPNLLTGGASTTVKDLVLATQLATCTAGAWKIGAPLPDAQTLLRGLLNALDDFTVPLPGGFSLKTSKSDSLYGVVLAGQQSFTVGDFTCTIFLGLPSTFNPQWGDAGAGIGLLLLDLSDAQAPKIAPALRLAGLGVGLAASDASAPLVSAGGFRLGGARLYASLDVPLTGPDAPSAKNLLGALELDGLGMFIASGDNSNPVASSLLSSGGSGDTAPANPPFDLMVATRPVDPKFLVHVNGKDGQAEIRFEINKTFGPLHIDDIALIYRNASTLTDLGSLGVGISGGVSVSGFALEVDDLSLLVPLQHPTDLSRWTVDLAGLALSFQASAVSISGGLRKATLTLPNNVSVVDYEGGLSIQVSGRGFSALGAYAQVKDPQYGEYASFFGFLAISMPIGGPPYLFITGLAGGIGFNRRLLTPRDPAAVTSFPLVSAMTGTGGDPMEQLKEIGTDIPPGHGAFWLAAGIKFSTFELLHTTALITLSIDHGFEVTLLGLMQLELPPSEPIASLELALAAKYSTIDQVLSLRAALTPNSWLISKDCQLTGGFAFIIWFEGPEYPKAGPPQVLLSIGGYSKYFTPPAYYPTVPQVGFHWNVGNGIVVKGGSFFTITQSGIMFGGSLEASYDVDPIRVWFSADLDVLVMWDPFSYHADISVEIGAAFHYDIDVWIGTITINVSVTLGASVRIEGPPLHGEATVELLIATVTVPFGDTVTPQVYLSWADACAKYLEAGGSAAATSTAVAAGALPGTDQPNGSSDKPWPVAGLFTMHVDSKMPASAWRLEGQDDNPSAFAENGRDSFDVVPCDRKVVSQAKAVLVVKVEQLTAPDSWNLVDPSSFVATPRRGYFPPAVWDWASVPDRDSATGQPDTSKAASDMVPALGAVDLATKGATIEGTMVGDIPFSTMVEDDLPPLAMSFGPVAPAPAAMKRSRAAKKPRAVVAVRAPQAPQLRMVLAPPGAGRVRVAPPLAAAAGTKPANSAAPLERGSAQVWLLDPSTPHRAAIDGAHRGIRALALQGGDGVVQDRTASGKVLFAPAGTRRLLVLDQEVPEVAGWELDTQLLFAGTSTAVAPGATVHTAGPWAVPPRYGRAGAVCWVPAVVFSAYPGAITTRFSLEHGSAPTVIVVRLDRREAGARASDVEVAIDGERLRPERVVRAGSRLELVFAAKPASRSATCLRVRVVAGLSWRLAGVLGMRGGVARWQQYLTKHPHARLARAADRRGRSASKSQGKSSKTRADAVRLAVTPVDRIPSARKRKVP